jgi:hypothetical protein
LNSELNLCGRKDDSKAAIVALNTFVKSFCLDCTRSKEYGKYIFRCQDCGFRSGSICTVKNFAHSLDEDFYDKINFGCLVSPETDAELVAGNCFYSTICANFSKEKTE